MPILVHVQAQVLMQSEKFPFDLSLLVGRKTISSLFPPFAEHLPPFSGVGVYAQLDCAKALGIPLLFGLSRNNIEVSMWAQDLS